MIMGTTKIDGRFWLVCLPDGGGRRRDVSHSQFNKMVALVGKENFHIKMATLCANLAHEDRMDDEGNCWAEFGHVTRRDEQECNWDVIMPGRGTRDVGFRPVFVPLKSAAGAPDREFMAKYKDGDAFPLGTLYMNGEALYNPVNPIGCPYLFDFERNGDCPMYTSGAHLRFGDTHSDADKQIRVVKTGNCFVADRVILGAVSYNDLFVCLQLTKYRGAKTLIETYQVSPKVACSGWYNVDSGQIDD